MRQKKARPGELRVWYGQLTRHESEDLCVAWGEGTGSPDARLLLGAFGNDRDRHPLVAKPGEDSDPPIIEELRRRGYDLSTLEVRIRKLATPRTPTGDEP
jgi:hypothetical protein